MGEKKEFTMQADLIGIGLFVASASAAYQVVRFHSRYVYAASGGIVRIGVQAISLALAMKAGTYVSEKYRQIKNILTESKKEAED